MEAQKIIAQCYENGLGVEQDNTKAFLWQKTMADKGNVQAMYYIGQCYEYGKVVQEIDYKEAFLWYKKAAELDNVVAQNQVAHWYFFGICVEKDLKEAFKWHLRTVTNPDKKDGVTNWAQLQLGKFYYYGWAEIEQDYNKAVKWFLTAANDQKHYFF